MENYIAFNIQWNTDGSQEIFDSLPKKIVIPDYITKEAEDQDELLDLISDYISNVTGYCHEGFEVKREKTKKLNLTITCQAIYQSHIMVPNDMSFEEAIEYAKQHLNECNIETPLEYIRDSDELDEENCDFVE